jgi:hypothetical protein
MARCKWCDKGGLFQKMDKIGLCKDCGPKVTADIEQHSNVIYEAMHVFERAQEPGEKASHCDRVIAAARHLVQYESKGLQTCSPPAQLVLDEYRGFREALGQP